MTLTAEDLDRIPDLPPHTELIDGNLVFASPWTVFHSATVKLIDRAVDRHLPEGYLALSAMTVTLEPRHRLEPDLIVVESGAVTGSMQSGFRPDDVLLAIDVVSPESVERDRERKPQLYAQAGIQHFWRVENVDDHVVVHVYRLDVATMQYIASSIHEKRLSVEIPFPIDIDLAEIDRIWQQ